jgi:hypothetical protein
MFKQMRIRASKLAREITFTLILKIVLIISIWYFFFSNPVDDSLTEDKVRHQILGSSQYNLPSSYYQFLTFSYF